MHTHCHRCTELDGVYMLLKPKVTGPYVFNMAKKFDFFEIIDFELIFNIAADKYFSTPCNFIDI